VFEDIRKVEQLDQRPSEIIIGIITKQ